MRLVPSSRFLVPVVVSALVFGACGDDSATPDTSNVPGVSSNGGDTSGDSGGVGTDLTGVTDPQMTAAPNPNAGAGGAGDGGGSTDAGGGSTDVGGDSTDAGSTP